MSERDTIFAVATGFGTAGIAVIRLSGNDSWSAIEAITQKPLPSPRHLARRWMRGSDNTVIDDGMVVVFERGKSFTGEPAAEIHCHGGRAVQHGLLAALGRLPNCRQADPGEFTRRAFESGLMDLTAVEGLADLIHAETEFQRRQALRVMSGAASDQAEAWRKSLVRARALIEVTIDWADEEVPENVSPEVQQLLQDVSSQLDQELAKYKRTERLREGFEVAIVGPPNVGKSTLINAIAGRTVAITSDIAGTTRDVIEVRCDLSGLPVTFLDTAGLRESTDAIEQAGVEVARSRAGAADLRLFLLSDGNELPDVEHVERHDLTVWTKADLSQGAADVVVSSKTGEGVSNLLNLISARLVSEADQYSLFGHQRQNEALTKCQKALGYALNSQRTVDPEVLAEHLREAIVAIDSLTGRLAVEDVLGEVFSSFCLGK